jgi:hypothetical protein
VDAALNVINPTTGGMWLVKELWTTKAAQFGNASQNYSQLALAQMLEMDVVLGKEAYPAGPAEKATPVDK